MPLYNKPVGSQKRIPERECCLTCLSLSTTVMAIEWLSSPAKERDARQDGTDQQEHQHFSQQSPATSGENGLEPSQLTQESWWFWIIIVLRVPKPSKVPTWHGILNWLISRGSSGTSWLSEPEHLVYSRVSKRTMIPTKVYIKYIEVHHGASMHIYANMDPSN